MGEFFISIIRTREQSRKLLTATPREGFNLSNLDVFAFCFVVVLVLVITHKWQRYVARKEETNRLFELVLTENAQIKREAANYRTTTPVECFCYCLVCYKPATIQCAWCKTATYCSDNCLNLHWDQGHKYECRDHSDHIIDDGPENNDNRELERERKDVDENDHHDSTGDGHKRGDDDIFCFVANSSKTLDNVGTFEDGCSQIARCIRELKSSVKKVFNELNRPKNEIYKDKGLFSYNLFKKLYASKKFAMQPCGFINLENSCYANAVLQCLTFTPPLTAYFLQRIHSKTCVNEEWCFLCELEKLVLEAKKATRPISPSQLISELKRIRSDFDEGNQEDAHEFLRHAIHMMQAGVNPSSSFEEETSLTGLTFGGYLCSQVQCTNCCSKSVRKEKMMDLTLEIEGNIENLEEALKKFTRTEVLDGDSKYMCCNCNSHERAKKKLTILEAPNVLTIALKQFQWGGYNRSIQFPETLDLRPYMRGSSDKSAKYRLYGVIAHSRTKNGHTFSGHYVCYVKNARNKWFNADDSTVTSVELESVLAENAYVLLYARCRPKAPQSITNQTRPHKSFFQKECQTCQE